MPEITKMERIKGISRELSRCPLFRNVGAGVLEELAAASKFLRADHGEHLFHIGGKPEGLFVIVSGEVKILSGLRGKTTTVCAYGAMDYFGEIELFGGFDYISEARVASETLRYIKIKSDTFLSVAIASQHLPRRLLEDLSLRMKRRNDTLVSFATLQPADRLAVGVKLDLEIERERMDELTLRPSVWAERVGASLKTVNECFREWREAGVIKRVGAPKDCRYRVDKEGIERLQPAADLDQPIR